MAFCGAKFSKELKEDEVVVDHSLTNVVAFSAKQKQHIRPSKEGLIEQDEFGKKKDNRIKVSYSDENFAYLSFTMICQVTAKLPDGMKAVGTCSGVNVDGIPSVLTSAHNLVSWSSMNQTMIKHKNLHMYQGREGVNKWYRYNSLEEGGIRFHPKYNGDPDCGYDIGTCPMSKEVN